MLSLGRWRGPNIPHEAMRWKYLPEGGGYAPSGAGERLGLAVEVGHRDHSNRT